MSAWVVCGSETIPQPEPGITVMAPADENECRQMLTTAYRHPGPAAVRYPRGAGPGAAVDNAMRELPLGVAEVVRDGVDIAIAAFGSCVTAATEAGAMVNATVVNMRFIKPLDAAMVTQLARAHAVIVTVEENVTAGGAGSAVNEALAAAGLALPVVNHMEFGSVNVQQLFIDDSMYIRHTWLFQPAPPPAIPAT